MEQRTAARGGCEQTAEPRSRDLSHRESTGKAWNRAREREAGRSQDRTHCVPVAHGDTEQTEGDDAFARKGLHEQSLGSESGEELRGTPVGPETRCHVSGATGALDGRMDRGTLRELERSSSTRATVGGDAVPQERRREVQSVSGGQEHLQGQTLLQRRHEGPTRHEVDLLSCPTRPGGSVLVAGCARTTGTVARR